MNLCEKPLKSTVLYDGKIIRLRVDDALLPDGKTAVREVIEHPGGAGVAAIDSEQNLLLVRQFRYPYQEISLEIPAGKKDKGEDPFHAAVRELTEETGFSAKEYLPLGEIYPTPGYCDEIISIYAAKGLTPGVIHPDEDEFVETVKIPLAYAVQMVMSGEIKDAKTQIAILKCENLVRNDKL